MYLGVLMRDEGEKTDALKLFHEAEKLPETDGTEEENHYKRNLALDIKKAED